MKNQKTENKYSRGQKILSWLVLIGIFVCGVMAGAFIWQKHVTKIESGTKNNLVVYNNLVKSCAMREEALLANVAYNIKDSDVSQAVYLHRENAKIYKKLASIGCDENRARYEELANADDSVADALKDFDPNRYNYENDYYNDYYVESEKEPCELIEETLLRRIQNCDGVWCHLGNAEVYSKMAEDGCAQNKETNTKKALDELQIADGVRLNDSDVQMDQVRSTINTYKKLQMINEARKYINKVQKLVDPGVEFIMELQRIVEE